MSYFLTPIKLQLKSAPQIPDIVARKKAPGFRSFGNHTTLGSNSNMFNSPGLGTECTLTCYACSTHLTEREKSPGALSLSRMRKAPSCLCLPNISSAFARGIFPKNHLQKMLKIMLNSNFNEEVSLDMYTDGKHFHQT